MPNHITMTGNMVTFNQQKNTPIASNLIPSPKKSLESEKRRSITTKQARLHQQATEKRLADQKTERVVKYSSACVVDDEELQLAPESFTAEMSQGKVTSTSDAYAEESLFRETSLMRSNLSSSVFGRSSVTSTTFTSSVEESGDFRRVSSKGVARRRLCIVINEEDFTHLVNADSPEQPLTPPSPKRNDSAFRHKVVHALPLAPREQTDALEKVVSHLLNSIHLCCHYPFDPVVCDESDDESLPGYLPPRRPVADQYQFDPFLLKLGYRLTFGVDVRDSYNKANNMVMPAVSHNRGGANRKTLSSWPDRPVGGQMTTYEKIHEIVREGVICTAIVPNNFLIPTVSEMGESRRKSKPTLSKSSGFSPVTLVSRPSSRKSSSVSPVGSRKTSCVSPLPSRKSSCVSPNPSRKSSCASPPAVTIATASNVPSRKNSPIGAQLVQPKVANNERKAVSIEVTPSSPTQNGNHGETSAPLFTSQAFDNEQQFPSVTAFTQKNSVQWAHRIYVQGQGLLPLLPPLVRPFFESPFLMVDVLLIAMQQAYDHQRSVQQRLQREKKKEEERKTLDVPQSPTPSPIVVRQATPSINELTSNDYLGCVLEESAVLEAIKTHLEEVPNIENRFFLVDSRRLRQDMLVKRRLASITSIHDARTQFAGTKTQSKTVVSLKSPRSVPQVTLAPNIDTHPALTTPRATTTTFNSYLSAIVTVQLLPPQIDGSIPKHLLRDDFIALQTDAHMKVEYQSYYDRTVSRIIWQDEAIATVIEGALRTTDDVFELAEVFSGAEEESPATPRRGSLFRQRDGETDDLARHTLKFLFENPDRKMIHGDAIMALLTRLYFLNTSDATSIRQGTRCVSLTVENSTLSFRDWKRIDRDALTAFKQVEDRTHSDIPGFASAAALVGAGYAQTLVTHVEVEKVDLPTRLLLAHKTCHLRQPFSMMSKQLKAYMIPAFCPIAHQSKVIDEDTTYFGGGSMSVTLRISTEDNESSPTTTGHLLNGFLVDGRQIGIAFVPDENHLSPAIELVDVKPAFIFGREAIVQVMSSGTSSRVSIVSESETDFDFTNQPARDYGALPDGSILFNKRVVGYLTLGHVINGPVHCPVEKTGSGYVYEFEDLPVDSTCVHIEFCENDQCSIKAVQELLRHMIVYVRAERVARQQQVPPKVHSFFVDIDITIGSHEQACNIKETVIMQLNPASMSIGEKLETLPKLKVNDSVYHGGIVKFPSAELGSKQEPLEDRVYNGGWVLASFVDGQEFGDSLALSEDKTDYSMVPYSKKSKLAMKEFDKNVGGTFVMLSNHARHSKRKFIAENRFPSYEIHSSNSTKNAAIGFVCQYEKGVLIQFFNRRGCPQVKTRMIQAIMKNIVFKTENSLPTNAAKVVRFAWCDRPNTNFSQVLYRIPIDIARGSITISSLGGQMKDYIPQIEPWPVLPVGYALLPEAGSSSPILCSTLSTQGFMRTDSAGLAWTGGMTQYDGGYLSVKLLDPHPGDQLYVSLPSMEADAPTSPTAVNVLKALAEIYSNRFDLTTLRINEEGTAIVAEPFTKAVRTSKTSSRTGLRTVSSALAVASAFASMVPAEMTGSDSTKKSPGNVIEIAQIIQDSTEKTSLKFIFNPPPLDSNASSPVGKFVSIDLVNLVMNGICFANDQVEMTESQRTLLIVLKSLDKAAATTEHKFKCLPPRVCFCSDKDFHGGYPVELSVGSVIINNHDVSGFHSADISKRLAETYLLKPLRQIPADVQSASLSVKSCSQLDGINQHTTVCIGQHLQYLFTDFSSGRVTITASCIIDIVDKKTAPENPLMNFRFAFPQQRRTSNLSVSVAGAQSDAGDVLDQLFTVKDSATHKNFNLKQIYDNGSVFCRDLKIANTIGALSKTCRAVISNSPDGSFPVARYEPTFHYDPIRLPTLRVLHMSAEDLSIGQLMLSTEPPTQTELPIAVVTNHCREYINTPPSAASKSEKEKAGELATSRSVSRIASDVSTCDETDISVARHTTTMIIDINNGETDKDPEQYCTKNIVRTILRSVVLDVDTTFLNEKAARETPGEQTRRASVLEPAPPQGSMSTQRRPSISLLNISNPTISSPFPIRSVERRGSVTSERRGSATSERRGSATSERRGSLSRRAADISQSATKGSHENVIKIRWHFKMKASPPSNKGKAGRKETDYEDIYVETYINHDISKKDKYRMYSSSSDCE